MILVRTILALLAGIFGVLNTETMPKTNAKIQDFNSLFELVDYFDSESKCVDHLAKVRWAGKTICPYCEHFECYTLNLKNRPKYWKCAKCRKKFSVRVGTIFEDSKISLRKWFIAIYLITSHKKGISSHQLARDLKVTQKTAWFILHRVRHGFSPGEMKLANQIEVDETYIGGKEKNKHKIKKTAGTQGRSTKTKTPVLGILERGGQVYAKPVKTTRSATILPLIKKVVEPGSQVFTDEWKPYRLLGGGHDHSFVTHGAGEYVIDEAHTNGIESFWALLKRGIIGIYHHVSDKHLERYVDEFTFRFNSRKMGEGERFDRLLMNSAGRLDYQTLKQTKEDEQQV